jgi:hypothetical protein
MLAIVTEPLARKLVNSHKKDPETGRVLPEASVSIVCIASILCPLGQLWFSWTSVPGKPTFALRMIVPLRDAGRMGAVLGAFYPTLSAFKTAPNKSALNKFST